MSTANFSPRSTTSNGRSFVSVMLVLITFLGISVITGVMGPIFPSLKESFQISNTVTAFFPFAFFIAYGVMSIPAGIMAERLGSKTVMCAAFLTAASGSFLFASMPSFSIALIALFCIGAAMAFLQVVINPLLRVSGGEENYAFYSMLGQLVFSFGGILSPKIYTAFVQGLTVPGKENISTMLLRDIVPHDMAWVSMYWFFVFVSLVLLIATALMKLPKVELNEDEKIAGVGLCFRLLKDKTVVLFFVAIMAYVGAEVGITTSISTLLQQYHGVDPVVGGSEAISRFWQAMAVGCFVGLGLMKILDSRLVLSVFATAAIVAYAVAIWGRLEYALLAYTAVGFFLSVMFPAIFSLGLNSVKNHHGSVAGIMCSGIAGGALVPVIIGIIADTSGSYRIGALFVFLPLVYILSIGLWAKPIVKNKTLSWSFKKDAIKKSVEA